MKYKLVAFDLDGTLVGSDSVLSSRVKNAIAQMQEAGVAGCVVTGRMYRAALPFVRELAFDTPVICYQGAAVIDPQADEVLFDAPLRNELVRELIQLTKSDGVYLQLYRNDLYYSEERNRFSDIYAGLAQIEPIVVPSLAEAFAESDSTKAVIIADPPQAEKYAVRLQNYFGNRAYITRSYPQFVEMTDPRVNKGDALRFVADRLEVPCDEIAAIGDAWNDEPLLNAAGFAIAMGSAPQELRNVADAVVADVAHDGVAEAIEKYILS